MLLLTNQYKRCSAPEEKRTRAHLSKSARGQKLHGDETIKEAQAYIENNLREKISMEALSSKLALGSETSTGDSSRQTVYTVEYTQSVKMEAVKKALETSRKSINE